MLYEICDTIVIIFVNYDCDYIEFERNWKIYILKLQGNYTGITEIFRSLILVSNMLLLYTLNSCENDFPLN